MKVDEITDEDLAVAIMAAQEHDNVQAWFDKWKGETFASWKDMPHSGDCTKQSWTCHRCVYEDAIKEAASVRKLLTQ